MALAAMQPRDDVSRTSAASLPSSSVPPPSTTSPPPAPPPRLPSLAHLYHDNTRDPTQAPVPAPPLPAYARSASNPNLLPSRPSLVAPPRVIGDPLLRGLGATSAALYSGGGGGGAAGAAAVTPSTFLPPPPPPPAPQAPSTIGLLGLQAGAAAATPRRHSMPIAFRGEKRKTEVVPPTGSSIKDYCAVLTPFIYKLYCLVSDEATNSLCCWSDDGMAFLVRDPTAFAAHVLPNYFKHNQFSSFVRQLNKYRFHKLAPGAFLFGHERFVRGRPDLLREIGRQRSPDRAPVQSADAGASSATPASPASKRARIRSGSDDGVEVEAVKKAVELEAAPLRGELAALRRENAQLNARVQQLEDNVSSLRQHVEFLQHVFQTQSGTRATATTKASPSATTSRALQ